MIRNYVFEKANTYQKEEKLNGTDIRITDELPSHIKMEEVISTLRNKIPRNFFIGIKKIQIEHLEEFDKREINALYKDGILYVTNQQDNVDDLLDDIVHEVAHHVETKYIEQIYQDEEIKKEFLKKRKELAFELASEGYGIPTGFRTDIKFSEEIDTFLYKRVGYRHLRMFGLGIFVRPYAATSLREYFAVGFEYFYLKNAEELKKTCPILYNKIYYLHDLA
jgi:hypothetical protein